MIDVLKAIALDRLAADVGLADHLIDDELPPCPQWFCDIMDAYKAAVEAAVPERQAAPIAGNPAPAKPHRRRRPSLARLLAKAKQLGVDVTIEPDGTFRTGSSASAPIDKSQTELDEWIAKHAH